jgi:hypothetical protein
MAHSCMCGQTGASSAAAIDYKKAAKVDGTYSALRASCFKISFDLVRVYIKYLSRVVQLASSSGQASEAAGMRVTSRVAHTYSVSSAQELYRKCGDSWALYGETDKRGEYYLSAAT